MCASRRAEAPGPEGVEGEGYQRPFGSRQNVADCCVATVPARGKEAGKGRKPGNTAGHDDVRHSSSQRGGGSPQGQGEEQGGPAPTRNQKQGKGEDDSSTTHLVP